LQKGDKTLYPKVYLLPTVCVSCPEMIFADLGGQSPEQTFRGPHVTKTRHRQWHGFKRALRRRVGRSRTEDHEHLLPKYRRIHGGE
jgi:hypothetical protein